MFFQGTVYFFANFTMVLVSFHVNFFYESRRDIKQLLEIFKKEFSSKVKKPLHDRLNSDLSLAFPAVPSPSIV